ncbi:TPA: protein YbfB, partial [Escherichia coli]
MKYIIFSFRAIWLALSLLMLFFSMHRLSLLDSTRDVSELISLMSYGMMVICF